MSSRSRGEWGRFRRRAPVTEVRSELKRGSSVDGLIDNTPARKRLREESIAKERDIRNSSAPPSVSERHYPKSFIITPKKEENEE